jgi:hypothetical protein
MRTGGADRDNDGWISVEELHAYAKEKVQEAAPAMTPEFYPFRDGGHRILLAKSPTDDPRLRYRKEVEKRVYQGGTFTTPARRFLNSLQTTLPLDAEIAAAIEAEVLKPYQEFQRKLREYEEVLTETVKAGDLSDRVLNDLKDYQTFLGLRDEDIQAINDRILVPKQAEEARQQEQ